MYDRPYYNNSFDFNNPFMSVANRWFPLTMREVFNLCEWIYRYSGIYRAAIERVARLFFTDIRYENIENTKTKEQLKDFLEKNYRFRQDVINVGIDYLVYGNSMVVIYLPFKRQVKCPICEKTFPIEIVKDILFNSDGVFSGSCEKCGKVNFSYRDIRINDLNKVNIIRIPPQEVELIYNKFSGTATYFWNLNNIDRARYRSQGTILLYDTPVEVLDAIINDKKLELKQDEVLHLKQPNLAGTNIEWGMPFALSCFPLIFYIAILRKANEAISMDYIIPLRIIFPQSNSSFQEASIMNLSGFVSKIRQVLDHHKQDPADWNISPTPIGYQVIGGEKRSLMISDDLKLSTDELLNSMGFPAELFYGTLSLQSTPMALRLLDNTYGLSDMYNHFINWTLKKVSGYINMEYIPISMTPLRWIDDIERRQMTIQLAAADKVSDITVLETYGFDYEKEQLRKMQQVQILAQVQEKIKNRKILEQQMGQESGPSGGGSPADLMEQAESIATELVSMPESQRRMELDNIMKTNPLLHDAVRGSMDRVRNKMRTQGMNMILQEGQ